MHVGVINRSAALWEARDQYLEFGNGTPPLEDLAVLAVRVGNGNRGPGAIVLGACIHLDMAIHPDTPDSERSYFVDRATEKLDILADREPGPLRYKTTAEHFRGLVYRAYCDMYGKAADGEEPDLQDLQNLYADLLDIGEQIVPYGVMPKDPDTRQRCAVREVRGVQFELANHLLNARHNVQRTEVSQIARPSLPREDQPYSDRVADPQAPWDLGVSTQGFLDQENLLRIQATTDLRTKTEHPTVITIASGRDLKAKGGHQIIGDALAEYDRGLGRDEREAAAKRMGAYEQRFIRKLGIEQAGSI